MTTTTSSADVAMTAMTVRATTGAAGICTGWTESPLAETAFDH
jgi:hypothetical protein